MVPDYLYILAIVHLSIDLKIFCVTTLRHTDLEHKKGFSLAKFAQIVTSLSTNQFKSTASSTNKIKR